MFMKWGNQEIFCWIHIALASETLFQFSVYSDRWNYWSLDANNNCISLRLTPTKSIKISQKNNFVPIIFSPFQITVNHLCTQNNLVKHQLNSLTQKSAQTHRSLITKLIEITYILNTSNKKTADVNVQISMRRFIIFSLAAWITRSWLDWLTGTCYLESGWQTTETGLPCRYDCDWNMDTLNGLYLTLTTQPSILTVKGDNTLY